MQNGHKKLNNNIPRPILIVAGAVAVAFAIAFIPREESFRNRLSDALFIEALLFFITSWLSHLKSGKLAFITFHPFKKKTNPQDWKDRIPKLGSPPYRIGEDYGATAEATEKSSSPEKTLMQKKIARRFRIDLTIAGVALFAIGFAVQYL